MAIDWLNPSVEMLAGLEAGRQEGSDTIDQHLLTIATLEGAHTSLQASITKLTTERNRVRWTLRYLFYARTSLGQKVEDLVTDTTAARVRDNLVEGGA